MSHNNDNTEDILFFREAVSSSIKPLLQNLIKEADRISSLAPKCDEEVAKYLFGEKHYKDPRWIDYFKADWAFYLEPLRMLLGILSKEDPGFIPPPESRIDNAHKKRDKHSVELEVVLKHVRYIIKQVQEGFVLESTLEYACWRKSQENGADEYAYLSRDELMSFLIGIQSVDTILADRFIAAISKKVGPSFRDFMMIKDYVGAEECIPSNPSKYSPIAHDVSAFQAGIAGCEQIYIALNKCIATCKKIDNKYYLKNFDASRDLPNIHVTSFDALQERLEHERSSFSQEEYLAITGDIAAGHSFHYEEPTGHEYFPGFKEKYWEVSIIKNLATAVSSYECIDEQDESLFMYLFFGYGSIPSTHNKLYWKDQFDARKKDGTVRHPSELYYLLSTLYQNCKNTFTLEFLTEHLEFSNKTLHLIEEIVPKGKLPQLAQRCNSKFKDSIDTILNFQE